MTDNSKTIAQPSVYHLHEIATWKEDGNVSLPTVQRGFVWRPYQVENLWDSLLRGYPIGSFVLTANEKEGYSMLDGQQRATAICLGFGKNTFRNSQENIKIFIDLDKPRKDDNRKFIFRVITRSHPWGYQRTDNTKTLTADNIRKAMSLYEVDDHLTADIGCFFPFDASLPVIFNLFIEAALNNETIKELIDKIYSSATWKKVKDHWDGKINRINMENENNQDKKKELPELSSDEKIAERINEILDEVKKMISYEQGQRVPALYLRNDNIINAQEDNSLVDSSEEAAKEIEDEENSNTEDEIENLFIRLNAGGTPLRGEELNYSILKSKIDHNLQKQIEDSCVGLFNPSRFITIAYRLFQQNKKQDNRDALTMKIKPKQFQRTVNEEKSIKSFSGFLKDIFSKEIYNGKTLLGYSKYLLEYNETANTYGLPYLMIHKIADTSPEIMFMFLYRLKIHKDEFVFKTDIHRKMIGMITIFMWLGRGEKQRDHSRLLANIWPAAKELDRDLFWSSSTIQRAQLDDILIPFPSFDRKHDRSSLIKLKAIRVQNNTQVFQRFEANTGYGSFIETMFYNRDLILYAQRKFLSKIFKEKMFHLDDTNVPFDWDHISPNRFVHKKVRIPQVIKDWYGTIGNFRAWPYSLNRMDRDNSPALKFSPFSSSDYPEDEKDNYEERKQSWLRFIQKNNHLIKNIKDLPAALLDWSFCNKKWANCKSTDMKVRSQWNEVYHLILDRTLTVSKEWYMQLKIDDLKPVMLQEKFSLIINRSKWLSRFTHDSILKDAFQPDGDISWVSKPFKLRKTSVYLYLNYYKDPKFILEEDSIIFGIFEKNGNYLNNLKIPEIRQKEYESGKDFVERSFTLISFDENAYINLFKSFKEWLIKFPNSKEINNLSQKFVDSLAAKYKRKIQ